MKKTTTKTKSSTPLELSSCPETKKRKSSGKSVARAPWVPKQSKEGGEGEREDTEEHVAFTCSPRVCTVYFKGDGKMDGDKKMEGDEELLESGVEVVVQVIKIISE